MMGKLTHPRTFLFLAILGIAIAILGIVLAFILSKGNGSPTPEPEPTTAPIVQNAPFVVLVLKRADNPVNPGPIAQDETVILQAVVSNMTPPYEFAWTVSLGSLYDGPPEVGRKIPHDVFQPKSEVWWTAPRFRVPGVVIKVTVLDNEGTTLGEAILYVD